MPLGPVEVFNQYAYTTAQELIAQQIGLFNEATRGALVLRSAANQGDYSDITHYGRVSGLVRRRNAYDDSDVAAVDLEMLIETSVKVAAGTAPVNIDPHWWQWIQRSPEEAGVVLGKQLGEDMMGDMLNTALKALVAAMLNVGATVTYDGTSGVPTLNTLNAGARLFGDRAGDIAAWIMHSKSWHDLVDASLTNTAQLFTFGSVKVMQDGLGRPFVVSDAADLFNATPSPDEYRILGLTPGAALVDRNNDYTENVETSNGKENIVRTWQAQWTYNLGLKGYKWDKGNGGASPTNAAIGTGTNWDKVVDSVKNTAGIVIEVQ